MGRDGETAVRTENSVGKGEGRDSGHAVVGG